MPIELSPGNSVDEYTSGPSWQDTIGHRKKRQIGDTSTITMRPFLDEEHHRAYGRAWLLGRFLFEQLKLLGLAPGDNVLDFGCGSGRVGIWLIPYLEAGRYFGLDSHLPSLVAFSAYEMALHDLRGLRPRLMVNATFAFEAFGTTFDAILDFAVSQHLAEERAIAAYRSMHRVSCERSRLFTTREPKIGLKGMRNCGWILDQTADVTYPIIPKTLQRGEIVRINNRDQWCVFRRD
ncbi:MAG TPA: class I SAM-dependent methyltransferase [Rhodocyclaceae bacterium]|nr:class I SAM-dependent methyltransferase [Rhodocyclaceae bacterium]